MTDTDLITAEGSTPKCAADRRVSDIAAPPGRLSGAMVLPELRALATKVGVKGVSGMRAPELIEAIRGTPERPGHARQPCRAAQRHARRRARTDRRPCGDPGRAALA